MEWDGLVRHHIDLALPLLFIRGSKGLLGCGYFDPKTFEVTGEAGVVVRGVRSFDDMLAKTVDRESDISPKAQQLGVRRGMTGAAVLALLR